MSILPANMMLLCDIPELLNQFRPPNDFNASREDCSPLGHSTRTATLLECRLFPASLVVCPWEGGAGLPKKRLLVGRTLIERELTVVGDGVVVV